MDSNDITRRRLVSALGAAGITGLAGCGGGDGDTTTTSEPTTTEPSGTEPPTTTEPSGTTPSGTEPPTETTPGGGTTERPSGVTVKIGAFQPLSGALKYYGQSAMWGFYSGLAYKGADSVPEATPGEYTVEVDGVTYEIILSDTGASPSNAQNLATDYVRNEDVDMLLGGTSSASAATVAQNVANRAQVPYMVGPAASTSITADDANCGPNIYRANETTAMDARSGGKYVADETDIEKVWIYYADYSFGQAVKDNYSRVLKRNGVAVVGETPLAQGYADDWPGQFQKAVDAGADGIVGGFTVVTLPAMLETFLTGNYDFNFIGGHITLAGSTLVGQTMKGVLGEITQEKLDNANMGPATSRYHWNQYDNPINDELVDIHTSNFGTAPDLFTSGMFTAASAIDQAVVAAGEASSDTLRSGLKGMTVRETPKGENAYRFQEYNNQARSSMTVADFQPTPNADIWPAAVAPAEPKFTFGMDETTLPQTSELHTCQL